MHDWVQYRWQDLVYYVEYMLDNWQPPAELRTTMYSLIALVNTQGFDWKGYFRSPSFPVGPVPFNETYY